MDRRTLLQMTALAALAPVLAPRAHAAERTQFRVGYIPIIPMTQLFIMEGEGWTKEAGLDLALTRFSSGPAMVQALASGSLDIAYVGIGPAMLARARGIDIKVVAANVVDQVALVGRGELAKLFAAQPAPAPAEAFAKFHAAAGRPAKIATLPKGSVPDTVLRYYLDETAHVKPEDVEILGIGEDQVQQSLLAGAVDGASILEPILTIVLEREKTARIIAPAGRMLPRQPGAIVVATAAAIAKSRPAIEKLVALHIRATKFVHSDPDKATRDVVDFIGKGLVDPATMKKALTSGATQLVANPHEIVESTGKLQDFQRKIGSQSAAVDLDQLFDFSFYDAAATK